MGFSICATQFVVDTNYSSLCFAQICLRGSGPPHYNGTTMTAVYYPNAVALYPYTAYPPAVISYPPQAAVHPSAQPNPPPPAYDSKPASYSDHVQEAQPSVQE